MFRKKVKFQLLVAKTTDPNDPNSAPITVNVGTPEQPKFVQDMDIICKDYPLKMPIMIFNQGELGIPVGSPLLVFNDKLYSVYNFTQVSDHLINIFVMYAGDPKLSPIAKKE